MHSLLERAVVLSFSRFANQAIVLFSPLLLVRILSVTDYGSYREFLLYAALISPFVTFGIRYSLIYFLPKYPDRESVWITQSTLFVLASSNMAIVAIFVAGDLIRANTSFDFVGALQLYILFLVNLDFLESYWLGKKRTDFVLFLSAGRLITRLVVVVTTAILANDARAILTSLIILEAIRCFLVFGYALSKGWFTSSITRQSMSLQLSYCLPLGAGGVVAILNSRVGMVFVSSVLGAEALAFYVIGAFAVRLVNVLRGAIADVIFPEIVELHHADPKDALPLWQRATVMYCVMLFPIALLFSYYADAVVTILFTADYSAAIPIFSAFALSLCTFCFDFHLPIRVQNKNRFFLIGNLIALGITLLAIWPMYQQFEILGPAFAVIIGRITSVSYLAYQSCRLYDLSILQMVHWVDVGKVALASLICGPILIVGKWLVGGFLLRAVLFGLMFLAAYAVTLRAFGVWDAIAALRSLAGATGRLLRKFGLSG